MDRNEQQAVRAYQDWLLHRFPQQIDRIVLFGSKARGDATKNADVDLLIVLRGDATPVDAEMYPLGVTDPVWREAVGKTFDFLVEYDVDISPTILHENEYQAATPLMAHVWQEGIELWKRAA